MVANFNKKIVSPCSLQIFLARYDVFKLLF